MATKGYDLGKTVEDASLYDLAAGVNSIAAGLQHLSDGLRATYLLIEKLEREIHEVKSQLR